VQSEYLSRRFAGPLRLRGEGTSKACWRDHIPWRKTARSTRGSDMAASWSIREPFFRIHHAGAICKCCPSHILDSEISDLRGALV
jgi:hypothetical protein